MGDIGPFPGHSRHIPRYPLVKVWTHQPEYRTVVANCDVIMTTVNDIRDAECHYLIATKCLNWNLKNRTQWWTVDTRLIRWKGETEDHVSPNITSMRQCQQNKKRKIVETFLFVKRIFPFRWFRFPTKAFPRQNVVWKSMHRRTKTRNGASHSHTITHKFSFRFI